MGVFVGFYLIHGISKIAPIALLLPRLHSKLATRWQRGNCFWASGAVGGRDGKIVSGLVKAHGVDEVVEQLRYFFEDPPDWIKKGSKFTIPAFKSAYNEILAKRLNGKSQMRAFHGG